MPQQCQNSSAKYRLQLHSGDGVKKETRLLSEQRGRVDLVLQAEVQVQPAWLKNVKLSLIAGRPAAWIPEGRTAVCLGGRQVSKAKQNKNLTAVSRFQDQLEYIFRLIEMPAQTKRESKCIWIRQGSQILSVLSFLANTWLPVPSIYKSIIDTTQNETEWPVRFKFCITLLHSNGRNHRHYSIDTFSENESPHNFSRENYINYLFI